MISYINTKRSININNEIFYFYEPFQKKYNLWTKYLWESNIPFALRGFLELYTIKSLKYFILEKLSILLQTSWVNVLIGTPNALASPKSANFINPFLSISKFCGFRSLCKILLQWQYFIAEMIWNKYDLIEILSY